ncbi:MAG: RagB/SusD family nutrient uptake outer membrane protein [Bacteroidales bacterium]|nr:RagB/SusD family nutrient uptake outer membrane protein [Bacteroidales bacterium]
MKRYIIIIATCVAALCSCSLVEKPTSFVNRDNYYGNRTQCVSALNGCYLPMSSIYSASFMFVTEACTDIWHSNSTTKDAILEVTPAKPQYGATMWKQGYMGVMRCNECIECIAAADIPAAEKEPLVAEARVLRAMYYYILTSVFNGVPYYKYMVADDKTLLEIRKLPRTDAREIREDLYYDLKDNALPYFTEENGLKVRASEAPSQRVGYALCLMLMAKMAMWNEDWDMAMQPLKALEELYGEFSEASYPLEQTMWRYKNSAESILEIQHDWSRSGVQYAGNVCAIMTPSHSRDENGNYLYDGVSIPELGEEGSSWSALIANNNYGIFRPATGTSKTENTSLQNALFNPMPLTYDDEYNTADGRYYTKLDLEAVKAGEIRGQKIDRRVYYTFGMGNLETGATFNSTRRYGVAWAGPKFWCPGYVLSYDSNNYKVFRYADVILMIAECYCQMENGEASMEYVNKIRERAGVDPVTNFTGFEALQVLIRAERARELGGEFQRKFDLVRWGIWYEQTLANTSSSVKQRIKPCHRYYPIPDQQCALSGYILTNDEYINDGL